MPKAPPPYQRKTYTAGRAPMSKPSNWSRSSKPSKPSKPYNPRTTASASTASTAVVPTVPFPDVPVKPVPPLPPNASAEDKMKRATEVLRSHFGLSSFRGCQEPVIHRLVVDDESAVIIMPTGGGKSLCFQLPAILFDGLTLVVSPLLSLMKDQVDALRLKGIPARRLDSTLTLEESMEVVNGIRSGTVKLLYVAPERFSIEFFYRLMSDVVIDLFAVDESHCISEWGPTFRPDYLKIADFAAKYNAKRVLALTATATPKVAQDICRAFDIDGVNGLFRLPSYRPNLHLSTIAVTEADRLATLRTVLSPSTCGPSIVYVTKQEDATILAEQMRLYGFDAKAYHAGLGPEERPGVQNWFMQKVQHSNRVVVATIAFGMGIDKADIRNVVHYHLPKSPEGYSQEIGRAGRDGLPSRCTLFVTATDIPVLEGYIRGDTPSRASLFGFLEEVLVNSSRDEEGVINVSVFKQSDEFDIPKSIVNVIYTYLDLHHHMLKVLTPHYSTYQYKQLARFDETRKDRSAGAVQVRQLSDAKKMWTYVELSMLTASERTLVTEKLDDWANKGYIELKGAGVVNSYQILRPPPSDDALARLTAAIYKDMLTREHEDVERLRDVIRYATHKGCLARELAKRFDDVDPVPPAGCGTCSWCTTGTGITLPEQKAITVEQIRDEINKKILINPKLDKGDARHLVRFAFGIVSPRIRKQKLKDEPGFGSLMHIDFDSLLSVFEEICAAS